MVGLDDEARPTVQAPVGVGTRTQVGSRRGAPATQPSGAVSTPCGGEGSAAPDRRPASNPGGQECPCQDDRPTPPDDPSPSAPDRPSIIHLPSSCIARPFEHDPASISPTAARARCRFDGDPERRRSGLPLEMRRIGSVRCQALLPRRLRENRFEISDGKWKMGKAPADARYCLHYYFSIRRSSPANLSQSLPPPIRLFPGRTESGRNARSTGRCASALTRDVRCPRGTSGFGGRSGRQERVHPGRSRTSGSSAEGRVRPSWTVIDGDEAPGKVWGHFHSNSNACAGTAPLIWRWLTGREASGKQTGQAAFDDVGRPELASPAVFMMRSSSWPDSGIDSGPSRLPTRS